MTEQEKALLTAKAKILKALAHPTRLWMAEQLEQGERCVCEFVEPLGLDFSTVSKHLSVMRQAGLVEDDKRGKQVYYKLKVPCVLNFMYCVEEVIATKAKDLAELMS